MWWFVGGYLLIAAAFYTYIVVTAQEEPEEAHDALGRPATTLAGMRRAMGSDGSAAQDGHKKSRAA